METFDRLKYYVIITPFFPTDTIFRGPFVYDLVKAIKRTGKYKDVLVFKPKKWNDKMDYYFYQGIKVHLFTMFNWPSLLFNGSLNKINSKIFISTIQKFNIPINNIAVAHGHTSSFGAYCLALKKLNKNITTILHHHDPDPFTIRNGIFAGNVFNLFTRAYINIKLFGEIDWHVTVSDYVKTNLLMFPSCAEYEINSSYLKQIKKLQNMRLKKAIIKHHYTLYNGVDTEKFSVSKKTKSNQNFIIGCIGNFVDWKNQMTLLKALKIIVSTKHIVNIKVYFIGTGPELDSCVQYAKRNNLEKHVKFLKEVDHSCLQSFYHSIDLFCLPSYFEGFGCVFTEAAACGVPYIIGRHQGASEYLLDEEKDKWTFDPMDENGLAEQIMKYYDYRYVQHYKYTFDINILVKNFIQIISI